MRHRLFWSVVALTACASPPASAPVEGHHSWNAAAFESLQPRYMQALDDAVVDPTGAAIAMEAEVAEHVDRAERADDAGELRTDGDRASAGLALIYGALLLERDMDLVDGGKIDSARLFGARRYAPLGSLADPSSLYAEGAARRGRAVALCRRAQRLRPRDGRIASWLASFEAHEESHGGALSHAAKGRLVAAVDVEPTFNLWTAFIALRDEPVDSLDARALFAKARTFVDSRKCRDVAPGGADARNCASGPLAPFNTQAALVMLADQYMKRGEDALGRGDIPQAMPLLGTARGILATLQQDDKRGATARWKNAAHLDARLRRLDALQPGQPVPDPSFWKSQGYEAVYACGSCHVK